MASEASPSPPHLLCVQTQGSTWSSGPPQAPLSRPLGSPLFHSLPTLFSLILIILLNLPCPRSKPIKYVLLELSLPRMQRSCLPCRPKVKSLK